MQSKRIFEIMCSECSKKYEVYVTPDELEDFISNDENTSPCCNKAYRKVWTFGYGKFNGKGFTKGTT